MTEQQFLRFIRLNYKINQGILHSYSDETRRRPEYVCKMLKVLEKEIEQQKGLMNSVLDEMIFIMDEIHAYMGRTETSPTWSQVTLLAKSFNRLFAQYEKLRYDDFIDSKKPYLEETYTVLAYNPEYGDHMFCQCGHKYIDHFNLVTKKKLESCVFCDCEKFEPMRIAFYGRA